MLVEVVLVENRLFDNRLKFSGQPDIIGMVKGDRYLTLIDLKTGQAEEGWWKLQNAAYRHLAKIDRGIESHHGMSVRLKADGSGCLCKRYQNDYRIEFNYFLGALNLWYFFNKNGGRQP